MNIFIIVIGYCITLGVIAAAFGKVKDDFLGIISSHSNTERLEAGKDTTKEKAERIEKERAKDPMNVNGGNAGNATTMNMAYGQTQLPDMSGVKYGNLNDGLSEKPNVFKGMAMLGASPALIAGELSTKIAKNVGKKIDEKLGVKKKISGATQWTKNKVYTAKSKIDDKKEELLDATVRPTISKINDTVKPKIAKVTSDFNKFIIPTKDKAKQVQGKIAAGKDQLILVGSNIKNAVGDVVSDTEGYRIGAEGARIIKKAVTGRNLMVDRFYAPKGTSTRKTVNILNSRRLISSDKDLTKTLSLEQAFSDTQNEGLSYNQLITLAGVYREINNMSVSGNGNYQNILKQRMPSANGTFQSMLQQVMFADPSIRDPKVIIEAAYRAPQILMNDKKQYRESVAASMTNKRNVQRDLQAQNMNFLNDGIIRNDSAISNQLSHAVDAEYKKDLEKRVMQNLAERSDLSLEEKEKQYEQLLKKQLESVNEEDRKDAELRVKQLVLADPEESKKILGEEGANKLKEHMEQEEQKVYQKNLEKLETKADSEFLQANSGYNELANSEVREARKKAEMNDAIYKAIEEIYNESEKKRKKVSSFEESVQRKEQMKEKFNANMQGNTPQPSASSTIHIPRSVQEQMARNQELIDSKSTG